MQKIKSLFGIILAICFIAIGMHTSLAQASVFSMIATFVKTLNSEMNALAITVKQTALSSSQLQNSIVQSDKTLAESIKILNQGLRVADSHIKYSLATGQPSSTNHISLLETEGMLLKKQLSKNKSFKDMQVAIVTETRDANHSPEKTAQFLHNKYCSKHESNLGLCAEVAKENRDLDNNFALTFGQDMLNENTEQGAKDYISRVVMLNTDSNSNCQTADCKVAKASELGYNAFVSMAAHSLSQQISEKSSYNK